MAAQRTSPVGPVKRQLEERSGSCGHGEVGRGCDVEFCVNNKSICSVLGEHTTSFARTIPPTRGDNFTNGLQDVKTATADTPLG